MDMEWKLEKEKSQGRILLQGISNTRDLGGCKTVDGRRIIAHRLIRSGTLAKTTLEDRRILTEDYGVRVVVDFRTDLEKSMEPDPELAGVHFIHNPILTEELAGITRGQESDDRKSGSSLLGFLEHAKNLGANPDQYVKQLYENLVTEHSASHQYGKFFEILLSGYEGAILWHCSAGKDRVGIGTALLLSALGVDRETIILDFVKTNDYLKEETDQLVKEASVYCDEEEFLNAVRMLNGVNAQYLFQAFQAIEAEYQTVDCYLEKKLGLTKEKKELLQNRYLV